MIREELLLHPAFLVFHFVIDAAVDRVATRMKRKVADTKNPKVVWTQREDDELIKAVLAARKSREDEDGNDSDEEEDWDSIADLVPGKKTAVQCYKRYSTLVIKQESQGDDTSKDDDGASKNSGSKTKKIKSSNEEFGWKAEEIELLKKLAEDYTKRNGKAVVNCVMVMVSV